MASLDEMNPIHAILSQQIFILEEICFHKREYKYVGMSCHSENFNKLSLILLTILWFHRSDKYTDQYLVLLPAMCV